MVERACDLDEDKALLQLVQGACVQELGVAPEKFGGNARFDTDLGLNGRQKREPGDRMADLFDIRISKIGHNWTVRRLVTIIRNRLAEGRNRGPRWDDGEEAI